MGFASDSQRRFRNKLKSRFNRFTEPIKIVRERFSDGKRDELRQGIQHVLSFIEFDQNTLSGISTDSSDNQNAVVKVFVPISENISDLEKTLERELVLVPDTMCLVQRPLAVFYGDPEFSAEGSSTLFPDLFAALEEEAGERRSTNRRQLGKWLASMEGRMVEGRRIVMLPGKRPRYVVKNED